MTDLPKPFGYVRDNFGAGHIFQHAPFDERERLLHSTETVYSHGQVRELLKASRQQMAEEAAAVCDFEASTDFTEEQGDDRQWGQGFCAGAQSCADVIRSLATPTEGKT